MVKAEGTRFQRAKMDSGREKASQEISPWLLYCLFLWQLLTGD